MTGRELRFAAEHKLPVFYVLEHFNPNNKDKNFRGPVTLEKASVGYYIGDYDIDSDQFENDQIVEESFDEGTYEVFGIKGIRYH